MILIVTLAPLGVLALWGLNALATRGMPRLSLVP